MSLVYNTVVKPMLFRLDPEKAHHGAVDALTLLSYTPGVKQLMRAINQLSGAAKPVEAFGLKFPNRVGLAAGFDKNADCWMAFEALGFGHVEIGTATYLAQPGNPKPRMFRYPQHDAIINRMGFNNDGAKTIAARLANQPGPEKRYMPLGVNIGKSKAASLDEAVEDYRGSFSLLAEHADYVALNVSSPNTPDLRKLQEEARLRELLGELKRLNDEREKSKPGSYRPILLKIAPDLSKEQLDDVLQTLSELKLDGIIATNTTISRPGPFAEVSQTGGLSGKPVREMSTEIIRYISKATEGKLPIIGVGGIDDLDSAKEKIDAGATLLQIYTGMIYQGPFFARNLARGLAKYCGDL